MSDSGCDYENFCLELIDGSLVGVIVEIFLAIYAFVGIAAVADGYLAVGLEVLVARWRVPEDVAGASFMALGAAEGETPGERGEAILGRAARREIGRAWNAAIDGAFGAGVRALSERKL